MAGAGGHRQLSLHDRRRPPAPLPFHLLEVSVVSAQDLYPAARSSMRTYAVAWVQPEHKLRTRLDPAGHTDPTWNDKFVFRVAPAFLRSDTAAVTVEVYAARRLPLADSLVGTARLVLSAARPSPATRFVALQVRRPTSLRPQGILNLGVALLDSYARSAPLLYADLPPSAAAAAFYGRETAPPDRSESQAVMEMKLVRWRAELPTTREHERVRKEKREHHRPDAKVKAKRERRPGGEDGERRKSEGGAGRTMRTLSFGRLSCFGVGGKRVEEAFALQ